MATKKITLNELYSIIKEKAREQLLKEELSKYEVCNIIDRAYNYKIKVLKLN